MSKEAWHLKAGNCLRMSIHRLLECCSPYPRCGAKRLSQRKSVLYFGESQLAGTATPTDQLDASLAACDFGEPLKRHSQSLSIAAATQTWHWDSTPIRAEIWHCCLKNKPYCSRSVEVQLQRKKIPANDLNGDAGREAECLPGLVGPICRTECF